MDLVHKKSKHRYIVVDRSSNSAFEFTCDIFSSLDVLCNIIICGDFNMSHINWRYLSQNVPESEKFCIKFVIDNGSFQFVTFPTRGLNILDLLLVDDKYLAFNIMCLCPF